LTFFAYRFDSDAPLPDLPPLPESYTFELVRPRLPRPVPAGLPALRFTAYAAFAALRIFRHRDYAVAIIRKDGQIVHNLVLTPPYWRFAFMSKNDIQIGAVNTLPSERGRSLAMHSVQRSIRELHAPGRRFWYIVEDDNKPSIRVAEKAGLVLHSRAVLTRPLGTTILGRYELVAS
jgi:RimJ/RimL family protein N-acetyltransferase